jgi:Na+-transporting NADH:ubiquinone oxidoreductase subunit B
MNRSMRQLVLASAPAAAIGCWNLGRQIEAAAADAASVWQLAMLDTVGVYHDGTNFFGATVIGLAFLLPLLAVSLAASRLWAGLFARFRQRPLDSGWQITAWLYTLLLPATMPLGYAALGLSFGTVFGSHVFGGAGRYIVNPALLGVVFLALAYPPLVAPDVWLPGVEGLSTWAAFSSGATGTGIGGAFLGFEVGAIGTVSALACLIGAAYLVAVRIASLRVVAAGLGGVALGAGLGGGLSWFSHIALGQFAFLIAFIATDTSVRPRTGGGLIAYGALFGLLTVVLRTANPEHPEGSWFALLLAMLAVPLLDYVNTALRLGRLPDSRAGEHD